MPWQLHVHASGFDSRSGRVIQPEITNVHALTLISQTGKGIRRCPLLLLLLNVCDDSQVCRHVIDELWAQTVMWRVSEMPKSYENVSYTNVVRQTDPDGRSGLAESA